MMRAQWKLLLLLQFILSGANGQIDGVCSCSPSTFRFTFNFSLSCPPVRISQNGGIEESICTIQAETNATDLVPVTVTNVKVYEWDQNSLPFQPLPVTGEFIDGESFPYTSLSTKEVTSIAEIPTAIQVSATGKNAEGENILYSWVTQYTNVCDVYPVIFPSDSAAWLVVVSLLSIEMIH